MQMACEAATQKARSFLRGEHVYGRHCYLPEREEEM